MKKITLILILFLFSGCSYLFDENHTPLMKAVFENNTTKVITLISETDNIDEFDAYGWTALAHASYYGQDEIVKLLLKERANINARSSEQGFFIQFIGSKPATTILAKAVEERHISTAKILIENGAFIDKGAIYHVGGTGDIKLLKLMVSKKNRDIVDDVKLYSSALCLASTYKNFKMFSYLMNHGANPNELQYEGCSALDNATRNMNLQMVKYMLEHGANPNIKLEYGKSVLFGAIWEWTNSRYWDDNYKIIELLLKHGAYKNFKPKNGDKTIVELVKDKIQDYKREDKKVAEYLSTILKILEG